MGEGLLFEVKVKRHVFFKPTADSWACLLTSKAKVFLFEIKINRLMFFKTTEIAPT